MEKLKVSEEQKDDDRVQLRLDTSQAEAALDILDKRQASQSLIESDWQRLFATEPYEQLKLREAKMETPFTDEEFQQFILSEEVARRAVELRRTLEEWWSRDLHANACRVLSYLPQDATIHASVYPMIKPEPNSFVYDFGGSAAIFVYLDPERSASNFENTIAHESHHIGFASIPRQLDSICRDLSVNVRAAVEWMGAFGEGIVMLAAAGDPDTHPHAVSAAEERARWDRDMANFNQDLRKLEDFFLDVIDGRLVGKDQIRRKGFAFFGVQGPWYTVGYRMSVVVERCFGRATLIACIVNPRQLLARYNTAATELNAKGAEQLAVWSPRLLQQIGGG